MMSSAIGWLLDKLGEVGRLMVAASVLLVIVAYLYR
jgi:hypothetical protein